MRRLVEKPGVNVSVRLHRGITGSAEKRELSLRGNVSAREAVCHESKCAAKTDVVTHEVTLRSSSPGRTLWEIRHIEARIFESSRAQPPASSIAYWYQLCL